MTLTTPDVDTSILTQMEDTYRCGDRAHPRGESHHDPAQPGEYVLLNPCCGDRVILCHSRAHYLKYQAAEIRCTSCGRSWAPGAYRYIPIHSGIQPL